MKLLKNLKIKNKLRIPVLLLFLVLLILYYFYFNINSLAEDKLEYKKEITAAGNKIRIFYNTFSEYINKNKSFEELNTQYQPLLNLTQKGNLFIDKEKKQIVSLEVEFNKIEKLFQENSQAEKEYRELINLFFSQYKERTGRSSIQQNPELMSGLQLSAQRVLDVQLLYNRIEGRDQKNSQLLENLDQTIQAYQKDSSQSSNTLNGPLPRLATESILAAQKTAIKTQENLKAISLSIDKIQDNCKELSESIIQKDMGKTNVFFAIIKGTNLKLLVIISVILLLAILILLSVGRLLNHPLEDMIERAQDLAVEDVDMTKRLKVDSKDEVGRLSDWFNKFLERLQQIIIKVRNSSDEVFNATKEITAGSDDLSARTGELAASITETTTTLEEFAETIRQNTENSAEADMMLVDFNQEIQEKSSLINDVTDTMTEIFESSKQIDNIIKVINDISFQTNLLALNAAVEAARAGEAGRGFAVVASEVRNLAQKTAESSKSIQDIVLKNVESTQKGMSLVQDTSKFFDQIVGVMGEIVEKVSNITKISRQQADNIEQITVTIGQMDQVAVDNAQLVEGLAETGKKVKNNALELQKMVIQFNVDTSSSSPPPEGKEKMISPPLPSEKSTDKPPKENKTNIKTQQSKQEKIKEESSNTNSATEDDFFGSPEEDGFEEF